jgi:phage shock protein A
MDRAEDPEKMLKQVILDMQNQLMQVKTQVAIAIADHHLLIKKKAEHGDSAAQWKQKAELAVARNNDDLARAALDRALAFERMAKGFDEQIADQAIQVENLKSALVKLEMKLAEAQTKSDLLITQHRRARAMNRAGEAQMQMDADSSEAALDRMNDKVLHAEALGKAKSEVFGKDNVEEEFARMEKEQKIEQLLSEIKARKGSAA